MILVVEPVFPNAHHAPVNAGNLRAIRLATGSEDIVFAAHPAHREAVFGVLDEAERKLCVHHDIEVIPAGGISFRRFRSQAGTLLGLVRRLKPRLVICLGTQPETLFACRLLTMVNGDLRVIAVLHGNLNQAVGWRSRDPRRRWFDDRSSLNAAIGSPAIQFVVLDQTVRDAAIKMGLLPRERCHVWPHPINPKEVQASPHRPDPKRMRIAFLGSAKRAKGFSDFVHLTRQLAARDERYEFSLIGALQETFPAEALTHIHVTRGFLDRADFLERLSAVDYICLPLHEDTYTLTVSGVILDTIAALKPLIALPTPMTRDLFRIGPVGYLCNDLTAMADIMGDMNRLTDSVLYGQFLANLQRACHARLPSCLATVVARLVGEERTKERSDTNDL